MLALPLLTNPASADRGGAGHGERPKSDVHREHSSGHPGPSFATRPPPIHHSPSVRASQPSGGMTRSHGTPQPNVHVPQLGSRTTPRSFPIHSPVGPSPPVAADRHPNFSQRSTRNAPGPNPSGRLANPTDHRPSLNIPPTRHPPQFSQTLPSRSPSPTISRPAPLSHPPQRGQPQTVIEHQPMLGRPFELWESQRRDRPAPGWIWRSPFPSRAATAGLCRSCAIRVSFSRRPGSAPRTSATARRPVPRGHTPSASRRLAARGVAPRGLAVCGAGPPPLLPSPGHVVERRVSYPASRLRQLPGAGVIGRTATRIMSNRWSSNAR